MSKKGPTLVKDQSKFGLFLLTAMILIVVFVYLALAYFFFPRYASAEQWLDLQPLPNGEEVDPQKVELGKLLFFDEKLSGDVSLSCSLCHDPNNSFIDGEVMGWGYPGSLYFRNTPTVVNAHLSKYVYWDGRLPASDLPTLVRDHISEAHFMNADGRLVLERLRQVPEYQEQFLLKLYLKESCRSKYAGI